MILQRILFPEKEICEETEMYFNGENFQCYDGKVIIKKNGKIETDTYFNSFSIAKWKKYTKLKNLTLKMIVQGKCDIYVCYAWIDSDNVIRRKGDNIVKIQKEKDEIEDISILFPEVNEAVIAYFKIVSRDEKVTIWESGYTTDVEKDEINQVKIAVGICTFKREEFIEKNLKLLKENIIFNKKSCLYDNLDIYVSDNGQTLDIDRLQADNIYIFPNKNLGGSGGFSRCIIEALTSPKDYSHIILMDDDILLDTHAIEKTYTFLSMLNPEYKDIMIGGSMLILNEKYRQFENAALYRKGMLKFYQKNVDLRTIRNVMQNEREFDVNYNAWCYCCMPMSKISNNNLPMPFFIHMDDVEYGVRNQFKVVTLNGINVWHPFYSNQRGAGIVYYDVHNKLITMSELGGRRIDEYAREWLDIFHRSIFNYDYERTLAACKGIEEFCKGIDYFKNLDPLAVQDMISKYNKGWYQATDEIKSKISTKFPVKNISRKKLILNYLLPAKNKELALECNISEAYPYRVKKLIIYNRATDKYCIYERNFFKLLKAKRACKKAKKLIKNTIVDVSFEWKDRANEITNIEFWKHYLGI